MRPIKVPTLKHNRVMHMAQMRGKFGAINLAPSGQPVSAQQGALQGAAAGATFGPIGAGVGAAIGVVVGLLSSKPNTAAHIGTWDTSLAQSIAQLPASAAGIGRQIPLNENSHGLAQFLEAIMATGLWLSWDTAILSNYDVCAHWATTFLNAGQVVTTAIVGAPVGQPVTVSIPLAPGAGQFGPASFTFTNPGIQVGPDKIAAQIMMGNSGAVYAMLASLKTVPANNLSSAANNNAAQKVFALIVDNIAASLAPAAAQPSTPAPNVAPAVVAASQTVNAAVAAAPPPPPPPPMPPVAVMAAPVLSPQVIEVQSQPAQIAAPVAADSGISSTTLLIVGAVALGAILLSKK